MKYELPTAAELRHEMREEIKQLKCAIKAKDAEIARLRERQSLGEASIQIVGALAALIPLKDTIRATETGQTMVGYFRQALQDTDNG